MGFEVELNNILAKVGLTEIEQKLFLEITKAGPLTLNELAKRKKIIQPTVYRVVSGLEEKGLVFSDNKKYGKRYTAHDPKRIVSIVANKRRKLRRLELDLMDLMPQMNALFTGGGTNPKVEIYQTREGYETLAQQSLECKEKTIYYVGNIENILKVLGEEYDREYYIPTRLKQGVAIQLITFSTPLTRENRKSDSHENRITRFLPDKMRMNITIMIFDNTVIFFSDYREQVALAITSESIAQAMKVIYNDLRSHAE